MKKILPSILVFIFMFVLSSTQTFAHLLEHDGKIGAILHIEPNDDPIARQQASLFFEFKDTTNKFTAKNCDCNIIIVEQGKKIYAQPLFQNTPNPSVLSASLFYTFPNPDVYQVIIVGTPLVKNAFQNFKLTYNVRAEQPPTFSQQPSPFIKFLTANVGFIVVGIILILFTFIRGINSYKHKKKSSKKS